MNTDLFQGLPLAEFDRDRFAILEPAPGKVKLPENLVIAFYGPVISSLIDKGELTEIYELGSILTPLKIYRIMHQDRPVAVVCPPGCGGSMAASMLEELIVRGCRKVIACGSSGCLKSEISVNSIVIPSAVLRDEGTSYHYLPPSRTITVEPAVVGKMEEVLKKHGTGYLVGLDWTTDAPYRETRQKIARRKAEGCLTVEMELASMLAVARFRKIQFGQYLLAGDDVSGEEWDRRGWSDQRAAWEKLFRLSVEACVSL